MIIAIDPGSEKCGLAILDDSGQEISRDIMTPSDILAYLQQHADAKVLIGNSANGTKLINKWQLKEAILVDERNSTLEARKLYWQLNPPTGLRRLIPRGLLFPPCPVDDLAALILGRRYLGHFDTPSITV